MGYIVVRGGTIVPRAKAPPCFSGYKAKLYVQKIGQKQSLSTVLISAGVAVWVVCIQYAAAAGHSQLKSFMS